MHEHKVQETKNDMGGFNMIKNMRKQLKNEKGLTLVELLAVIVILGIIAAIAIPAIGNIIKNSKYNAAKSDAINVLNAAQMYYLDNTDAGDITDLSTLTAEDESYLESTGVFADATNTGFVIKAGSPLTLTTTTATEVKYDGNNVVIFSNVSIDDINADNQKGSKGGNLTVAPKD